MANPDMARRNLALNGEDIFGQVLDMADYAREEINAIGGYYAFGKELINNVSYSTTIQLSYASIR